MTRVSIFGHPDAQPYGAAVGEPVTDRALAPSGSQPWVSDVEWADDPNNVFCTATTKKGEPCTARRAMGTEFCVGHGRSAGVIEV